MESDASRATGMIGLLTWIEVNKRRLLVGGVTSLVALFVLIVVFQHQAQKEVEASAALSEIRLPNSAAAAVAPGTADALFKFAAEHEGTKAAARALLLGAGILFAEQTPSAYAEAQKRFTELLQQYPASPWSAEANLGIAKALAAQGKTNEATAKYEDIRSRLSKSSVVDEAKLDLARLYEAQKPEEAFRLYEELKGAGMGSSLGVEAGMHQDELVRQRPELAKLREQLAPPTPPANPLQNLNLTNRVMSMTNNPAASRGTNVQQVTITNQGGSAGQPVQIKLSPPAATPAAPNAPTAAPQPAPSTGSGQAPPIK